MALIIACLPEKDRKNLRFASFAPSESNKYTLVGLQSEGCVFAGWKRMMMAWLAGDYVEQVETYISEIRTYLEAGDLAGISRTSQRHRFQTTSAVKDPLDIQPPAYHFGGHAGAEAGTCPQTQADQVVFGTAGPDPVACGKNPAKTGPESNDSDPGAWSPW